MKSTLLSTLLLCFFSSVSIAQFKMDTSIGMVSQPIESGGFSRFGFYLSASPSISIKDKFRLRFTLQYRKQLGVISTDSGRLDLGTELEYEWLDFISFGTGVYASRNLNILSIPRPSLSPEIGPMFFVKFFKVKGAYATIRFNKPLVDEVKDLLEIENTSLFIQRPRIPGYYQFGLGYTFGKKNI